VKQQPSRREPTTRVSTDLVEYFIIAVPDIDALETVGPALAHVAARAAIRVLDVVVVTKGWDGSIVGVELDDLDSMAAIRDLDGDAGELLSENDITLAASALRRGCVGVIVVTEDRWAEPLSAAAHRAGGQIIAGERIPSSRVESALADQLARAPADRDERGG
jgi:hypothetical protein